MFDGVGHRLVGGEDDVVLELGGQVLRRGPCREFVAGPRQLGEVGPALPAEVGSLRPGAVVDVDQAMSSS